MTQYSKSTGFMDIHDKEESIILTGGDLDRLLTDYAAIDVFKIERTGVSSDPDTAADFGTDVDEWTDWTTLDDTTDDYAQSFKAGHTMVNAVKLYMKAANSFAGTLAVGIYTDNTGVPGTIVGTAVTKTDATISTTKSLHTFTFTDVTGMTAGNTYWIVISLTARTAGNVVVYGNAGTASSYADGSASNYRTDTWYNNANGDLWFRVEHDAVAYADADVDRVWQCKTNGGVDLAQDQDENTLFEISYSSMYLKRLDDYLDTYTSMQVAEHVLNALGEDPRMFWLTIGILLEQDKIEITHGLCKCDPSGGEIEDEMHTLRYKCRDIDNLWIKGA